MHSVKIAEIQFLEKGQTLEAEKHLAGPSSNKNNVLAELRA